MIDQALQQVKSDIEKVIAHLESEFSRLQIGRASAALVEGVQVEVYGSKQPLKAVASITVPDGSTIQIQPWDKAQLGPIEKAIQVADLNVNPVNDGVVVRINIPPLTEERRRDLTKVVHRLAEESRIGVRNARQKMHDTLKHAQKDGDITEDDARGGEKRLQEVVDKANQRIEDLAKKKESDIMTV